MKFDNRDDIIQLTPLWKGERFPDGRPKVPADIVRRMEKVTTEEAWAVLWGKEYRYQFEPDWKIMHPDFPELWMPTPEWDHEWSHDRTWS